MLDLSPQQYEMVEELCDEYDVKRKLILKDFARSKYVDNAWGSF